MARTRHVTVELTETEARKLLIRANDSLYDADDPEIYFPSLRAQAKIAAALAALDQPVVNQKG